jgi:hypothetical protein
MQTLIGWVLSCFLACGICIFGITNVAMYGSDLIYMTSPGRLLFVVPLMLFPVSLTLVLQILRLARMTGRLRSTFIYGLTCIAVAFIPSIAIHVLSSLELDSVVVYTDDLNNDKIQKLQDLEVSTKAFPFAVRFHWRRKEIDVVFKRANGHDRIVKEILSEAIVATQKEPWRVSGGHEAWSLRGIPIIVTDSASVGFRI